MIEFLPMVSNQQVRFQTDALGCKSKGMVSRRIFTTKSIVRTENGKYENDDEKNNDNCSVFVHYVSSVCVFPMNNTLN